jgi:hypothetical protein
LKNKLKFKRFLLNNQIKIQHDEIKQNLRPKWTYANRFELYHNYFLVFAFSTFHTLSYLSHYLEPIYEQTLYDDAYYDFYILNLT